jgi:hypothetical protein
MPLPTSREYASSTLSEIEFWLMYYIIRSNPYSFAILQNAVMTDTSNIT